MASLQIEIDLVLQKFQQGLKDAATKLEGFSKQATKIGKKLSLAVTAPLLGLAAISIANFEKQAQAVGQIEAALLSTGNAAGKTSEELQKTASDLQKISTFGDEEILKGVTSQLLTFTNIAGDAFDRTQLAALNLATRIGGDLQGAAIQLGKALNDPVANLSALSRSGIQFSIDQKTLIKSLVETNRLADAQTIILDELEKQFGGSAEAAAKLGTGPLKQLSNNFGDLLEDVGKIIVEGLAPLIEKVSKVITFLQGLSDKTKATIVFIAGLAAAIGPLLLVLGSLGLALPAIASGVAALGVAINFALGPIGLTITAIAALTAGIIAINNGWRPFEILVGKSKDALDAYEISTNKVSEAQEILNKLQKNYVDLSPSQIAASKENILAKIDEARATLQLIEAERLLAVEEAKKITTSDIVRSILLGNSKEQERVNQVNEEAAKEIAGINEELNKLTVSLLQVPAEAKAASDAVTTLSETGKTAFEVFSDLADLGNEKVFQKFADDADAFNRKLNETIDLQNRLSGAESNLELKSSGIVDVGVNLSGPPVVEVPQIDESSKTRFITSLQTLGADIDRIVENTITGSIADLGFSIGQALASGENVFSAIGQSLLNSLGDFLGQLGKQLIAYGVAGVAFSVATKGLLNPLTAAPSALALIGAGTALTLISGAIAGVLRGGGATGGSGAGGSTAGAGQSFEGTGTNNALVDSFGALEITGQSKIQGTDIIISYEKAQRANGR